MHVHRGKPGTGKLTTDVCLCGVWLMLYTAPYWCVHRDDSIGMKAGGGGGG